MHPATRLSLLLTALMIADGARAHAGDPLAASFADPPISARPLGWWHWINGNVTKGGIDADLEAAQRAGMGGVQMFDVEMYLPPGPVRYGSEQWHEHVQHAIRKAGELGLEFHVMNTPGWSASGGPWVSPELSMKRLVWSETTVDGGDVSVALARPDIKPYYDQRSVVMNEFYRDIAVIAVPPTTERIDDLAAKTAWAAKPVVRPGGPDRPGISQEQVIDLSERMDASGRLVASLPPGPWTILRFGYTTTGKTNHPAVPEGHGLEIDKLDAKAVAFQFEQSMGRMIADAGPLAGRTFNGVLFDSFEGGFQNWTATLPEQFRALKGYDLIPWLPVLAGRIVRSRAASEAVLWDFRHVIEHLFAENYFGTMHRLAAAHGLKIYSETQGGPITPMSANRHVDMPMNEFWTPDVSSRATRIKQTTSAAGFLGRSIVAAEAFTSTPEHGRFQNTPGSLKRPGDQAFTLGLNRFALHSFTHQPVTSAAPGFTLGRYGAHFGRLNTWWPYAGAWIDYLSRSQFLLQQGRTVADVCFLVDEDLGYGLSAKWPYAIPGYDFEFCYPPDLRDMSVRDGVLVHPSGARFRLLVTPDESISKGWVAELTTLRHLRDLVRAGASLSGSPPVAPAGLKDLEQQAEFEQLVREIWPVRDRPRETITQLGAGRVYAALSPLEILKAEGVVPDLAWNPPTTNIRYIHRTSSEGEIYFVFNDSDEPRALALEFRQSDKTPEIWNPVSGAHAVAPVFRRTAAGMSVPLNLEPWGSTFVIFRKPLPARWITAAQSTTSELGDRALLSAARVVQVEFSDGSSRTIQLPPLPAQTTITGPWSVGFTDGRGAPPHTVFETLGSWSEHAHSGIRHYAGTAVYRTRFEAPELKPARVAVLDLGGVADIARIVINGRDAGVVWKRPFCADVTLFLRPGSNSLEIHVANRWINRLIGDEGIPVDYEYQRQGVSKFTDGRLTMLPDRLYDREKRAGRTRQSFSTWKHYDVDSPLVPAGLLGPVTLSWMQQVATD